MQIWTCEAVDQMSWARTSAGLVVGYGGLCLTADENGQDASPVYMDACGGGSGQQWAFWGNGNIVNAGNGRCLDIQGPSVNAGTAIQVWTCEAVPQHRWQYSD